jgi:hypothetical protein
MQISSPAPSPRKAWRAACGARRGRGLASRAGARRGLRGSRTLPGPHDGVRRRRGLVVAPVRDHLDKVGVADDAVLDVALLLGEARVLALLHVRAALLPLLLHGQDSLARRRRARLAGRARRDAAVLVHGLDLGTQLAPVLPGLVLAPQPGTRTATDCKV